jgi:uncharacterized protein (TIGR02246 family)
MGIHRHRRGTIRLALISGLGMALISAVTPALAPAADAAAPLGSRMAAAYRTDPELVAVSRIWEQMARAWARGDGNAYAANYTPDADLINIKGEHIHTRNAIAARIQHYFDTQLKHTRLLRLEEKVRFMSPTMAVIVRKDCVLYGTQTACRPDTLSINTSVAVKRLGRWLIESFHNTLVRPESDPQPPFRSSD